MTTNKPSIILVLGMHRSGTSLVAQLVAKWGAYMGDDLMPANEFNKDGYWEYNPLVNLHDKMLAYTGNAWYAPPVSTEVSDLLEVFGNEARALVDEMDAGLTTWCWKDPRMALFLPFWNEILKERKLLFIISYRNPLSVADSLKKRDNIPTLTAAALWEIYTLKIFEAIKGSDACFFGQYENLIDKPDELTKQLFDFLNTQLHEKQSLQTLQQMRSAIKSGLKHSLPCEQISIDEQQYKLYALLLQEIIPTEVPPQWQTRLNYSIEITGLYHKGNYYKERNLHLQLFYKQKDKSYNETDSIIKKYIPNSKKIIFEFDELNDIESLRFDPLNDWLQCSCGQLELYGNDKLLASINSSTHNAIRLADGSLFFITRDPQVHFKIDHYTNLCFNKVVIHFNYMKVGNECKIFFAENPSLFLNPLFPKNENQISTDNSFLTFFNRLEEKIRSITNLITENENIIKQKEVEIDSLSKLKLTLQKETAEQKIVISQNAETDKKNKIEIQKQREQIAEYEKVISNLRTNITISEQKIFTKQNHITKLQTELDDKIKTIEKQKAQIMELNQTIQSKDKQMQEERRHLDQEIINTNEALKRLMANERKKLVHQYHQQLPTRLAGNLWRFMKHPLAYYRMRRDTLLVRQSGLFDDTFYLEQNSDLYLTTVDLLKHYMQYGWKEGRNPNRLFDTKYYLGSNHDIKVARINPLVHYIRHGKTEGRNSMPLDVKGDSDKMAIFQISKPLSISDEQIETSFDQSEYHILKNSNIDWSDFFTFNNIRNYKDPIDYYIKNWKHQSLVIPNTFDTKLYLSIYPDIAKSGLNPLVHFIQWGKKENRLAYFNLNDHVVKGGINYDPNKPTYVIACHESSATGAPLVGLNLSRELRNRFNIISLILRTDNLNDSFIENSILQVENFVQAPVFLVKEILKHIYEEYNFEVIICNSIGTFSILEAASQLKYPTVLLLHEFSLYTKPVGTISRAVISCDRIITPAQIILDSALSELSEVYRCDVQPGNMIIAPQGKLPFIPESYGENLTPDQLKKAFNVKTDSTKIIIGAGYTHIRKGVDLFISVAEKIKRRYDGELRFIWVGDGYKPEDDFNYSLWLKIQIESSTIKDDFIFLDHQKNLENILSIADCFLLTSRLDPFPNVVIDALYADTYVACFDGTTGCADFIKKHQANADVVTYLDVHEMAERVLAYLYLSDAQKKSLKGLNKTIIEEHLDFSNYIEQIESEVNKAKKSVAKRVGIEKIIKDSKLFDNYFYRHCSGTENALDFYVKSSLKGIHLSNPLPGFSEKTWLKRAGGELHKVPLYELIKREELPKTHNCLILNGDKAKPSLKIAIHIHLYYIDLAEEFSKYLSNISSKFDLFITVCSNENKKEIERLFCMDNLTRLEIIEVKNIGRDIAPLFIDLKKLIFSGGYDVIGHFHSKKSIDVSNDMGNRWRRYLLDNLMGHSRKLNQLLNQFKDPSIGLIFAEDSYSVDMSDNQKFADELCEIMDIPKIENSYVFPLGTMFWARPEALKPLFNCNFEQFIQPEPLPYDGTYLHAVERLLPHCAKSCGFDYITVYTEGTGW